MLNRIKEDLKQAMLNQDKTKTSVLRMALTALNNEAISKGAGYLMTSEDCVVVLKRMVKSRQDSIEQFTKGGSPERSEAEQMEIDILNTYLPRMLSEEELSKEINKAVTETGALTKKDIGKLMKWLKDQYGNGFDGKMASTLVNKVLV